MLLVAKGRDGLRLQPFYIERTPSIAAYSEPAGLEAAAGIGFLGPSYAVIISDFSPIALLDDIYLSGEQSQPFMVVFFPYKVLDAVTIGSAAVDWVLLTSNGDVVYAPAEKRLSIPSQLSDKVSEARETTCSYKLYHDPELRHVGAFFSAVDYLNIVVAWGGKKLVLVALNGVGSLVAGCDKKPSIMYTKVITFPDDIIWAGGYDSNRILWILTAKGLYAMPVVSYKFQTAWLPVSPEKLRPVFVTEAKSFAIIGMNDDAVVLFLQNGKIVAKYVENEWEGVAKVRSYPLRLEGVRLVENGEKPVKIMILNPTSWSESLLALQYPSSVSIYSFDEDQVGEGIINATREVTYTLPKGDEIIGFTIALLHGDKEYSAVTKKRYGIELGENIFISGIVVVKPDGRLVAVLDYEGR